MASHVTSCMVTATRTQNESCILISALCSFPSFSWSWNMIRVKPNVPRLHFIWAGMFQSISKVCAKRGINSVLETAASCLELRVHADTRTSLDLKTLANNTTILFLQNHLSYSYSSESCRSHPEVSVKAGTGTAARINGKRLTELTKLMLTW